MSAIDHDDPYHQHAGQTHFDVSEATLDDHVEPVYADDVPVEEVAPVKAKKKAKVSGKTLMVTVGAVLAVVATAVVVFGGKGSPAPKPMQMAAPSALPPAPAAAPVTVMPAMGVPEPLPPSQMAAAAGTTAAPNVMAGNSPVTLPPAPAGSTAPTKRSADVAAMIDATVAVMPAATAPRPQPTVATVTAAVSDPKLEARVQMLASRVEQLTDRLNNLPAAAAAQDRQAAAQQSRRPAAENAPARKVHVKHAVKKEPLVEVVASQPVPAPSVVVLGASSRGDNGAVPVLVNVQGVKRKVSEGDFIEGIGRVQQTGLQDGAAFVQVGGKTYR